MNKDSSLKEVDEILRSNLNSNNSLGKSFDKNSSEININDQKSLDSK